jgi:hypothetical protein
MILWPDLVFRSFLDSSKRAGSVIAIFGWFPKTGITVRSAGFWISVLWIRIRKNFNFLLDPDSDLELEVLDPVPDPEPGLNLNKT